MQACLARLYVDDSFRRWFFLEPEALREYRLSDDECASIRRIAHDHLESFASSLRNKRMKRVERAYPLLFGLDGGEIRRYWARYHQLRPARTSASIHDDAQAFGAFIAESLTDDDVLPSYAGDLARYERLCYIARFVSTEGGDPGGSGENSRTIADNSLAIPRLREDAIVETFDWDVVRIAMALETAGSAAVDPSWRSACAVVLRPRIQDMPAAMLRLNDATKCVVSLCDGVRSLSEIIAGAQAILRSGNVAEGVVSALQRLLVQGIITLRAQPDGKAPRMRGYGALQTEAL